MDKKTYLIIEHFRDGGPRPVYERFRERGRLAPAGLDYLVSWVDASLHTCYQVMATADAALLEQWMSEWRDLVDFEVHEVISSAEAARLVFDGPQTR